MRLIRSGIPQGSILGPILFIIYVNDMPFITSEANCILYADNTKILISDSNIDNLYAKASIIFSMFSQWFTTNRLALNDNKTNFMVFMPP